MQTPARTPPPAATVVTSAAVTSGPCPNAELIPTAANLAQVDAATLCLVNQQRIQNGELPLRDNSDLDTSAARHSEDMVTNNYFEHTTPSGEPFNVRIAATGYLSGAGAYEIGENIACSTLGLATPSRTVEGWMNSPGHRANILNGEFRDSGIGVSAAAPAEFAGGQPGATYTQDFGVVSA